MKSYYLASRKRPPHARRGAVMVYVSVSLVVVLSFVAFCVDTGWITSTKSELQNVADASAAAGARQLMDNYGSYLIPSQTNRKRLVLDSRTRAADFSTQYGKLNRAGGVKEMAILPDDIQIGYTDANGVFSTSYSGYPNTVQVIARRDSSANGTLPLFFAPVMGMKNTTLKATSAATIYSGMITAFDPHGGGEDSSSSNGFDAGGNSQSGGNGGRNGDGDGGCNGGCNGGRNGGRNGGCNGDGNGDGAWGEDYGNQGESFACTLLPVAFDVNHWNTFFNTGESPDGAVHSDITGTPQIQIYPSPHTTPGNFGLLNIGQSTNSTPEYRKWILKGPSVNDLEYLMDHGAFPVSIESPKQWKGSPGLRNTLRSEFAAIQGQPRLLPLFKPARQTPYEAATGVGSNATYAIVGFVGVTVTDVVGNGNNLVISVKPCDVIDPTAVFDPSSMYPIGAEPAGIIKTFTHTVPKFTQ